MKRTLFKITLVFLQVLCMSTFLLSGQESVKCSFSFNYSKDLSDTFGGGNLLSGEFILSKSWYGAGLSYGNFQSHSTTNYQIVIEEDNKIYDIPFDEMAIMQTGSFFTSLAF